MTTVDFRQHYTPDPHWLLGTVFGRDLLKMRLRQVEPGLKVPEWKYAAHLDPKLERMVDDLDLRERVKPSTLGETLKFMTLASRSMLALSRGEPLPEWP
ncbi:hypothetical protein [Hydrogenophaga laconesensis]|uniref:Uncharacterized protein n=1 Tax=Hydrogenophaga laconesensis TaxID=1805971 RepID=A0ABU1VJA8_9BURK|nr:hypothetical protein [Hydrogenophaga laconesensis]MDR7097577.1 hypothetical protein [Hydrogenophaga laconesensis]